MKRLFVLAFLLAAPAYAQEPKKPPAALPPPLPDIGHTIPPQMLETVRKELTLEEMLDALNRLKEQQAEIAQKVKAMTELIEKKMEVISERMNKMGLGHKETAPRVADERERRTIKRDEATIPPLEKK